VLYQNILVFRGYRRIFPKSYAKRKAKAVWRCENQDGVTAHSNRNPLHLVEVHLVASAIVELRGAGRGVVRHRGGVFERAAVFQIRRDAGRPEGVIADLGVDAGGGGAPASFLQE
jgi:hypothetical protein